MKDKQRKILRPLLIMALAGSLAACGSSGSSSGSGSSASTITAYVAKGPVNNAVCTLYRATDGAVVAGPATSTGGEVDFGDTTESGLMYVSCAGGAYTDEATGKFATAGVMRAVKNVQGSTEFIVTPVTEVAVRIAEAGNGIAADGEAANARVADYLGLDGIDIVSVRPTDLNTTAAADDGPGRYGTLLNAFSLAAADVDGDGVIDYETPGASVMDTLIGNVANAVNDDVVLADTVLDEALDNSDTVGGASGNVDADVATDIKNNMGAGSEAPVLADVVAQTYTQGVAISPLTFTNSGGGSLTACTADSLPAGLSVAILSGDTCQITGTPTAAQSATDHTITAANAAGSDTAMVNITVTTSLPAPVLADAAAQTYIQGVAIPPLSFTNSGGGSLTACTEDSLPAGLSVAISGNTCEITGTPTAVQNATTHTITATNAAGSDTATVNITVTASLTPPVLADAAAQTYTQGTAIPPLSFTNSGGGSLTACTADSLPTGLSVAISGNTCEITGTPTAVQGATTHTITATNAVDSDTATVSITVNPAAPVLADASAQTYTQGTAISPLSFTNSGGGSLTACTEDSLPAGLSVAISGNTCQITGTPTGMQGATTHTITATNVTGSDTATVSITVNSNPIITGVSPSTGSAAGGTTITISGSNFYGVTSVTVGGNAATSVSTASTTSVTAVTPSGSVGGAVNVVLTNSDGQTATDSGAFTYRNACEDCELDANGCPF